MSILVDIVELAEKLAKRSKDRADLDIIHRIQTLLSSLMQTQMESLDKLAKVHERNESLLVEIAALQKLNAELRHLLAEETKETVRILRGVEFRNGPRTGGAWQPFCPGCHLPAVDGESRGGHPTAGCSGNCGWHVYLRAPLADLIASLA